MFYVYQRLKMQITHTIPSKKTNPSYFEKKSICDILSSHIHVFETFYFLCTFKVIKNSHDAINIMYGPMKLLL